MLALLVHGIIPHHHHNAEAEKCNLEEHYAALHHAEKSSTFISSETCCEDHHSNEPGTHACHLNVAVSKQLSLTLLAVVVNSFTFQNNGDQPKTIFYSYSEPFIASGFSEVRSLRAPPLG